MPRYQGAQVRTLCRQNKRNYAFDRQALTSIFGLCFMLVCRIKSNCYSLIYSSLLGILCGGHGSCVCGACICDQGWSGTACDCFQSQDQCISEESGEICNNHGQCDCGGCKCDDGWTGVHCDHCPTCVDTCDQLAPCIECLVWKSGDFLWNVDMEKHPQVCMEAGLILKES